LKEVHKISHKSMNRYKQLFMSARYIDVIDTSLLCKQ